MKRPGGSLVVGSALGAAGAALAAIAGTLCCAGPAVVAVLGTGGALAAAKLEPYRPYLLAVSVVFLAFGFWRAYVPAGSGVACNIRTGRPVRVVLWVAAIVTIASVLLPRLLS